ncbi:MAG: beta-1,6-N-acetylglucosaminyltransferase [Sediminibacterium sp.]
MRLAHLILAHNNPFQLERLIKRLSTNRADVYIHLDKKSSLSEFKHLSLLPNVFFITNRTDIGWGNYSMVDGTLKSFVEILQSKIKYTHINLLSGHDYLLKPARDLENFLFENTAKNYLEYLSINNEWQESKERITKYSLGDLKIPFKYTLQKWVNQLLPDRTIPNQLEPYGRSQWMTLTPQAIKYVIEYLKNNPKALQFFKRTWGVDEVIFQTILLNSPLKDSIINNNLRFIEFEKNAVNPRILTQADAKALLDSGKFIARKFSLEQFPEIILFLDNELDK